MSAPTGYLSNDLLAPYSITAGSPIVSDIVFHPGPNETRFTAQGMTYRGTLVEDAGAAHTILMAVLKGLPLPPPATTAPPVTTNGRDACAEMRALCSACGGTGDVHRADGEWLGECTCVHTWRQRAEKVEADLKQVNAWREAALYESRQMGDMWAEKVEKAETHAKALEAQLVRRRAPLSPETQLAIETARAAGQSIATTPGGLVFLNDGAEPDYSELDCPTCSGSGHAGDVAAGSAP